MISQGVSPAGRGLLADKALLIWLKCALLISILSAMFSHVAELVL